MIKKTLALILLITLIISCSNDDEINSIPEYSGIYNIQKFNSNKAVDLNNDGVSSENLMIETDNYFSKKNNYDLEILPNQDNNEKIIVFEMPHRNPDFVNSDNSNEIDQKFHEISFSTFYNNSEKITLELVDFEQAGRIKNFKIIDNKTVQLNLEKEYYNFESNSWEQLSIEVEYKKIHP